MSAGPGWVQMACLWRIQKYEERGESPTTFNIAAEVYQVKPDKDGNRYVTDAQHVAVNSSPLSAKADDAAFALTPSDGRTELCHHWMTEKGLAKWLATERKYAAVLAAMGVTPQRSTEYADRIAKKAKAIGMKLESGAENKPERAASAIRYGVR